jgi:hypothetical protein
MDIIFFIEVPVFSSNKSLGVYQSEEVKIDLIEQAHEAIPESKLVVDAGGEHLLVPAVQEGFGGKGIGWRNCFNLKVS